MYKKRHQAFTLVEIMIVVAIIAALAAIAIPNLLRSRISANDALAKNTIKVLSTASETYGTSNSGNYPGNMTSLVGSTPQYLSTDYCSRTVAGFSYTCTNSISGYTYITTPVVVGTSGTTTFTITTGGVLTP